MENNGTKIFYTGIAYGAYPEEHGKINSRKVVKEGLPIKKLSREFPYLLGEKRAGAGRLLIYYALLPEYRRKNFFSGQPKGWKPETAQQLLEDAVRKAIVTFDCREQLCAPELHKQPGQIPIELTAALLYRQRPFDKICITLAAEGGEYGLSQVIELINPYLPRTRQVFFKGEDSPVCEMLEDYLYDQFGIIMTRTDVPPSDIPWLDMEETDLPAGKAPLDGQRHINSLETLKFLDTAVKNGYNTKVN